MRQLKLLLASLLAGFGAMAMPQSVSAAVIVDQQAIVPPNIPVGPQAGRLAVTVGSRGRVANGKVIQTITAGVDGILNAVELQGPFYIGSINDYLIFHFSLWDGDAFAGTGSLVGFQDVVLNNFSYPPSSALNSQATSLFDVSSLNYAVTPGKLFSIAMEAFGPPDTAGLLIVGNSPGLDSNNNPTFQPNQYAGGALYVSFGGSPYSLNSADLGFRTYVAQSAPAGVPEPAAWIMMIVGFSLVGFAMRRRVRVNVSYA